MNRRALVKLETALRAAADALAELRENLPANDEAVDKQPAAPINDVQRAAARKRLRSLGH